MSLNVRVIALALLVPCVGSAQRLAGTVRDPAGQPVASAVVSLTTATGASLARTVTDRGGAFVLPVGATARVVTVIRIGFLPFTMPLPDSAHVARASITVTMEAIPHVLEPIHVIDAVCPDRGADGQARALWEQARAGFLASVVAREAAPADAQLLHFVRMFKDVHLVRTAVEAIHFTSTRPIVAARSPAMFMTAGYIDDSPTGRQYFGPDADVLVDDVFRATHCFSMAKADKAHPNQIGIAFAPAAGRDTISDIQGVLWLDRSPLALRDLEFLYTGLEPAVEDAEGGGRLSFRTADNGIIVVGAYDLRMPEFHATSAGRRVGRGRVVTPPRTSRDGTVSAVHESGGILVLASWPDGTTLTTPLPTVSGKVTDAKTGHGLSGVDVAIPWTTYHTRTSADGAFAFPNMVPGKYPIAAYDSSFGPFGIVRARTATFNTASLPAKGIELSLDSTMALARHSCTADVLEHDRGVIAFPVADSLGRHVRASVNVTFYDPSRADGQIALLAQHPDVTMRGPLDITANHPVTSLCGAAPGLYVLTATDSLGRRGRAVVHVTSPGALDTARIVVRRGPPAR